MVSLPRGSGRRLGCMYTMGIPCSGHRSCALAGSGVPGVGCFVRDDENIDSVSSWCAISNRILMVRFRAAGGIFASFFFVYAPVSARHDERRIFFDELSSAIFGLPAGDILVITGDLNSRVGKADDTTFSVLGPEGERLRGRPASGTELITHTALTFFA